MKRIQQMGGAYYRRQEMKRLLKQGYYKKCPYCGGKGYTGFIFKRTCEICEGRGK